MLATNEVPGIDDILDAAKQLDGALFRTPLFESERLNARAGARIFLKCEMFQPVGAFKLRGAWNMISRLTEDQIEKGVVAYSSGNHAQAVAWAARRRGIEATIVMPNNAPSVKIENTKALGANVILYDRAKEDREAISYELATRTGAIIVPPYNHPQIIAGQGTVGLEAMAQMADMGIIPDLFIVPCSGGGLIAGCAIAVKEAQPDTKVFAVEPENFDDTFRSLRIGKRVMNVAGAETICDALMVKTPGEITFEINRKTVDGGEVVTDAEVRAAVRVALLDASIIVEPSGAVGLAAVLAGRLIVPAGNICVVLSGGNIDEALFAAIISGQEN